MHCLKNDEEYQQFGRTEIGFYVEILPWHSSKETERTVNLAPRVPVTTAEVLTSYLSNLLLGQPFRPTLFKIFALGFLHIYMYTQKILHFLENLCRLALYKMTI